ncbi:MAG: ABC transporter substrate-binding protein [Chloroflexi bacterium]|nr:ABC transporter substrate-binding protein [Chloroflexota bacterium]
MKSPRLLIWLLTIFFALAACAPAPAAQPAAATAPASGSTTAASSGAPESKLIRIAKQPGLGYLELIIMKEQKLIEKRAPGVEVQWTELTNGSAIRDAILAGQLEIGSGGVTPFLQSYDKGLKWRIVGALNEIPLYLNTYKPEIKSIKDFGANDKIALPVVNAIQHVILQMQAEKELGDAHKLDNNVVAMAHPDAMAALLSKREITAHMTSPPFQYQELNDQSVHRVLSSYDVFGGAHTFNILFTSEDWKNKNPILYKAFVDALNESVDFINKNPKQAAEIFNTSEKSKDSVETTMQYMQQEGTKFTTTPHGVMKFANFMKKIGTITNVPASWKEYAFDNLQSSDGS